MKARSKKTKKHAIGPQLRVYLSPHDHMGPGKADLLALIGQTGSIVAAGKAMGMSYRRAWLLVETMNSMFETPLVTKTKGGKGGGGGAALTALGREVLGRYRNMERMTRKAIAADVAALRKVAR
ncbi:MAG: winged helix-turn-helix domain-containing protein [Rhodospirillaceae bacterium]